MKAFETPTEKALSTAKRVYSSPFLKEVFMNGFTPDNFHDHFGVSILIERGGMEVLTDMTFTKKTGKLVKSELVNKKYI